MARRRRVPVLRNLAQVRAVGEYESYRQAVRKFLVDNTEIHGGIGFTEECDVQVFSERVGLDRVLPGSSEELRVHAAHLQGWVAD